MTESLAQSAVAPRHFHGCAAGWGLIYVKPNGEVWPCPFVPLSGGNLRRTPLLEIYSRSEIFRELSDRDRLRGRCGECENRHVCGGCRGKAYAATGDPLAEDPTCYLHHQEMPHYLAWREGATVTTDEGERPVEDHGR